MTPEQERLFYEMAKTIQKVAGEVDNLHTMLYKNGFSDRIKKLENYVDNASDIHKSRCPVSPILHAHLQAEKETVEEAKTFKQRKLDIRLIILGVLVAVGAALPSWISLAMRLQ